MCGIVGYKGEGIKLRYILESLKLLEYRGYDSAGLAFYYNGELKVQKVEGKIDKLSNLVEELNLDVNLAIAHTRWATHGVPNEINAHPHISGTLALVHNGIIENYQEIKDFLKELNFEFKSETDSEVIVHLVNHYYRRDLFSAVIDSVKKLEGSFAFLTTDGKDLVAVKHESPIVIGITNEGYFVSSDIPSLLKFTKKIIALENGDIALISKNQIKIYNFIKNKEVQRNIDYISWDISIAEKSGYKHFMLKEINEQGRVIKDTLSGRIDWKDLKVVLDENVRSFLDSILKIDKIVYIGCGTSYHAGLLGSYYSNELAGTFSHAITASEFRYINKERISFDNTIFIFISQSGETADTLFVARELKERKANIITIPNVIGSSMYREFLSFPTRAGVEIGVAATKTFIAQITNILLLNLYIAQKNDHNVKDIILDLSTIYDLIDNILENYENILSISEKYVDYNHFMYLGRHLMYPIALEGALKLKEISYIHAEAYPSGEMKHGPIALIDNKMPTFYLIPYNKLINKNISNIQEIKARKGKVITLVDKKSKEYVKNISDDIIEVPFINEYLQPILFTIPVQIFAYYIADWKGLNVDQPRNLAKSVTVE